MDHDCTFFWLIPENEAALRIVHDEKNSRFRDTVPVISAQASQTSATTEMVDCFRVGFNHEHKEGCLLAFGRGPARADITLRERYYSRWQAELYIDPASLDLVFCDHSFHKTTFLLFNDDSGPVGRWRASDNVLVQQAILPSSNAVLAFRDAEFTFRWYPPSQDKEIQTAKEAFIRREIDQIDQDYFLNTEYPLQYTYRTNIKPLALLDLPSQIRYMIFRLLLLQDTIIFDAKWKYRPEKAERYNTVHGCIYLLNISHQLLNPVYSSRELATEAADVFYRQNVFQINILELPSFVWTLKHMPSVGPLIPLSTTSRLRLCLNCDRTLEDTIRDELYNLRGPRERRSRGSGDTPIIEYEWSDSEKEELAQLCTAVTTSFPALRDVEFHIRKQGMCSGLKEPIPDANPPPYLFEKITPAIKELMDQGDRNVKVFLHGQRWDKSLRRACHSRQVIENITEWWGCQTDEDEKLLCEENLNWLKSVDWHFNWVEEDWRRKGAIEGAKMRRRVAERDWERYELL